MSGTQTSVEGTPTVSTCGSPQTSHDEIGPSDSASRVGSQLSSTTRAGRRGKIAILRIQCNAEQEKAVLQARELELRQQRRQLEMRAELEAAMIEDEALEQEELELAAAGSGNAVGTSRACEAPPGPSGAIPIDSSSAHGSHSHPDTTGTPAAREGERGGAVEGYGLITLGPETQKAVTSPQTTGKMPDPRSLEEGALPASESAKGVLATDQHDSSKLSIDSSPYCLQQQP